MIKKIWKYLKNLWKRLIYIEIYEIFIPECHV